MDLSAEAGNLEEIPLVNLPETKVVPENPWLEDEFSFLDNLFSGIIVGFREG